MSLNGRYLNKHNSLNPFLVTDLNGRYLNKQRFPNYHLRALFCWKPLGTGELNPYNAMLTTVALRRDR